MRPVRLRGSVLPRPDLEFGVEGGTGYDLSDLRAWVDASAHQTSNESPIWTRRGLTRKGDKTKSYRSTRKRPLATPTTRCIPRPPLTAAVPFFLRRRRPVGVLEQQLGTADLCTTLVYGATTRGLISRAISDRSPR
ncbi:hypothetical protein BD626DRAFT_494414 [Schizophyllum amplum]|uniref:Uncharacterized protein n=1 Tax=Schizophyllum amplum TaxID=97359 RepID=A0A550CF61_9AGAR|nr:hypothetical protein BD626DRAFT_494414 [Auriculariopsis ampla]